MDDFGPTESWPLCPACLRRIHPLMNVRATGSGGTPRFVHYDCFRKIASAPAQERNQK